MSFARTATADPLGDYQSWIWETGVFGENDLSEEVCFGSYVITFAGDLTWSTSSTTSTDVCYGRTTSNTGRVLDNAALAASTPGSSVSTRPLVNAGGKLWELYGEDVGGGDGEERLGAVMSDSTENLAVFGAYESFSTPDSIDEFRLIDMWVKSTNSVQVARTAVDLEGTSWRAARFFHSIDASGNTEAAVSDILSFTLDAGGSCTFSTSTVLPGFTNNADLYLARQSDDGIDLDNRSVMGGPIARADTTCSYTITDTFLEITRTIDASPVVTRYVVSDNNRYLINAPAATLSDSAKSLFVGYRAASSLAATAIDGTYLFYLPVTEFGADGTGAADAGFGPRDWQELDLLGRGKVVFDSTTLGTTPTGEGGAWKSCSIEMVINQFEHEFTGSTSDSSIALGAISGPESDDIPFTDCSFQLGTAGDLSLFMPIADDEGGEELMLRGYVNDNGEVLSLTLNEVEEDPLNLGNVNEDLANIIFLLGMKYTGNPAADADADGLSNFGEFKFPLPVLPKAQGDFDGDGMSDILWRNSTGEPPAGTGQNWLYTMNGATIASSAGINTVSNLNWAIVGDGDYDGDGNADILLRNSVTGQNWMYLMNGATIASSVGVNTVSNLNWAIVGDGDYDGDGSADILLRNSATGQNWMYLMNGATIASSVGVNTVSNLDWEIVGSGDYDGDGSADILLRNSSTGQNWMYLMNGATIASSIGVNTVSNLNWAIVGDGDYDGDGNADILLRNSATGQNWMYLMNGATIASGVGVNTVSNLNWEIVGSGDYDGDGSADILLRNSSTGQNWMYLMNGATIASSMGVNTVPTAWQIVNAN